VTCWILSKVWLHCMHIRRVVEESKEGDTELRGPYNVGTCSYLALAFSCPAVNSSREAPAPISAFSALGTRWIKGGFSVA
jgi:hypothetical protein